MSLIFIQYVFSTGATIIASQHNSNNSVIFNDYNGNITDANIAAGAGIEYTKLALSNSIKSTDIASSTVLSASNLPVGTSAGNIVQLNGSAQLPAVSGALLTNLPLPTQASLGISAGSVSASADASTSITFPFTYSTAPIVVITSATVGGNTDTDFWISSTSTTGAVVSWHSGGGGTNPRTINWIAVGTHA